jgi:hypothetical protein
MGAVSRAHRVVPGGPILRDQVFFATFFEAILRAVVRGAVFRAVRFVTLVAADFSPPPEDVPGSLGLTSFSAISFTSSP